jgi:hypothetical protein
MITLTAPPNWDLPTLNVFIAQQENFLRGQLTGIKSDGETTILELDDESGQKPQTNTVLTTSSPPPGARVVGSAEIFIGGKPAMAIAYRP